MASEPPEAIDSALAPEGSWLVAGFDAFAEGLVSPRPTTTLTVSLLPGGLLEGETGCGTYVGGWTLDGQRIGLQVISKGPDPCGIRRTEEAVAFSVALSAVTSWAATATTLELLDESGRVRVVLEPASGPGLEGDWLVARLDRGSGRLVELPGDGGLRLSLLEDGSMSGGTGCRTFEGTFTKELDRITFAAPDLVGLPCAGTARRLERWLLRALDVVVLWDRDDDELRLTDGVGSLLVGLRPDPASPPSGAPAAGPEASPSRQPG